MDALKSETVKKELTAIQTAGTITLVMPDDLFGLYKEPLRSRAKSAGINLRIMAKSDASKDTAKYDRKFLFEGDLVSPAESDNSIDLVNVSDTSDPMTTRVIRGVFQDAEDLNYEKIVSTKLEKRASDLKKEIQTLEQMESLKPLLTRQYEIRRILLEISEKKSAIDHLVSKINALDTDYYNTLALFTKNAIDDVLQLVTLGDIMKRYIKILLIDDLGEKSLDALEQRGFRKRYLTHLSSLDIHRTFNKYKLRQEEQYPDKSVSFADFFRDRSIFEPYEIVIYNPWKIEGETLNIQFRLKKALELSRKEIRQLNESPDSKANRMEQLHIKREELESKLKSAETELHEAETKGNVSEQAYVLLNKKRKRILRDLNAKLDEIKQVSKELSGEPVMETYHKDLLQTDKKKRPLQVLINKKDPKIENLIKLAEIVRKKKEEELAIRHMNNQIKLLIEEMDRIAELKPLHPDKDFQQLLGIYALNRIEYEILIDCVLKSQSAIHVFRHPHLLNHSEDKKLDWSDPKLNETRIRVVSKDTAINTDYLQAFFRIDFSSQEERLTITPTLPTPSEFNEKVFDALIIVSGASTSDKLLDCFKQRNVSQTPTLPILLIDGNTARHSHNRNIKRDLIAGVTRSAGNPEEIMVPPYVIASLDDIPSMINALCFQLGINPDSVPDLNNRIESNEFDPNDINMSSTEQDDNTGKRPSDSHQLKSANDSDSGKTEKAVSSAENPTPPQDDQLITIEEEEIYTLNALFSFDDGEIPTSDKIEKKVEDQFESPNSGEAPTQRPDIEDSSHRERLKGGYDDSEQF